MSRKLYKKRSRNAATSSGGIDKNYKYVPIYTAEQHKKDASDFAKAESSGVFDFNVAKRLLTSDILANSKLIESGMIGDYRLEDIKFAIIHPRNNWRTLLSFSAFLMRISPYYMRLCRMYSNMARFRYTIDLYGVKSTANMATVKKQYTALSTKLEDMNLEHEFQKIMDVLPYQDIYCGLTVENEDGFFIQQINYNVCKLYEVDDGLLNFVINLANIKPTNIGSYPIYVQEAYSEFIDGNNNGLNVSNWYYPPSDVQVCVKMNSDYLYPFPILIGLIDDIMDLNTYKKLKLQSARTDNYKAILMKVPIDENAVDKPLLTEKTLVPFSQINRENMSDDIGLLYTLGTTGEAISFKDSSNTRNNVSDAVNEIYDASGTSKELYNGSSSGTAVTFSVENDSALVYHIYRQLERWMNRFIKERKYSKSAFKFKFKLIDMTIFNVDTVIGRYKDACTLGAPVVDKWLSSLGMTPATISGSYIIHNEVFDFYNQLRPLQSSYNGASGDVGRPTAEESGTIIGDAGETTRDYDSNMDR